MYTDTYILVDPELLNEETIGQVHVEIARLNLPAKATAPVKKFKLEKISENNDPIGFEVLADKLYGINMINSFSLS
jgi:hypothetical protein